MAFTTVPLPSCQALQSKPSISITPPFCCSTRQPWHVEAMTRRKRARERVTTQCVQSSSGVVDRFFDIASTCQHNADELVSLLSDEVLDAAIAHAKQNGDSGLTLEIGLETCLQATRMKPFLDSYGTRACQHSAVVHHELLNSVLLSESSHLYRHRVVLDTEEIMLLTFVLTKQMTLRAAYRSVQSENVWVMNRVTGESEFVPDHPTAMTGPESCLARQLRALQECDISTVFAFASPENQASTGGLIHFSAMLHSPAYRPLLHHTSSQVLHLRHTSANQMMALVRVCSTVDISNPQPPLFIWTISRQECEHLKGCWMTSSVQAVPIAFSDTWPTN